MITQCKFYRYQIEAGGTMRRLVLSVALGSMFRAHVVVRCRDATGVVQSGPGAGDAGRQRCAHRAAGSLRYSYHLPPSTK